MDNIEVYSQCEGCLFSQFEVCKYENMMRDSENTLKGFINDNNFDPNIGLFADAMIIHCKKKLVIQQPENQENNNIEEVRENG